MKTLEERIEVMQAALDGKEVEFMYTDGDSADWRTHRDIGKCTWNWSSYDYRVKHEPLELWVNIYSKNVVPCAYFTEEGAIYSRAGHCLRTVKVREVTE